MGHWFNIHLSLEKNSVPAFAGFGNPELVLSSFILFFTLGGEQRNARDDFHCECVTGVFYLKSVKNGISENAPGSPVPGLPPSTSGFTLGFPPGVGHR